MIKALEWNLSYPNPIYFLQRASKADEYNIRARTITKYLVKIACLEWRLLSVSPSLLAAAAIWLPHLILNNENWVCLHLCTVFIYSIT